MRKRYRLYFNTKTEAPHVCSVDEGAHASEIVLQGAELHGVFGNTVYAPDNAWPEPKFWIEFEAVMAIEGGIAVFQG